MTLAWAVLLVASGALASCRRAIVIVPQRAGGYTGRDTLYGTHRGNRVLVTFRHDTTWRVDTIVRLDTLWRAGTRTLYRVDTVRQVMRDTIVRFRVDTVRVAQVPTATRVTGRVDSLRGAPRPPRRTLDTVRIYIRDTVRIVRRDTIRIVLRDTVRVFTTDTVQLPGRRVIHVPPGHYPPPGQCRVWILDRPPGQQADPAPCNQLGNIPAGAFILFGGEAYDFDYDWVTASRGGGVPPEIVALSRRRRP